MTNTFYTDDGYLAIKSQYKIGDRVTVSFPDGDQSGFIVKSIKVKEVIDYQFRYTIAKGKQTYKDIDELYLDGED